MKTIFSIASLCSIALAASLFGQSPVESPQPTMSPAYSASVAPTVAAPASTPLLAASPVASATPALAVPTPTVRSRIAEDMQEEIERRIERKLRRHLDVTIDRDGGDDIPGELIAIPIIGLIFLAPVLIIGLIMFFNFWKARQLHRTVRMMVEKGQEVPPALFAAPAAAPVARPRRSDMRRGIILVMVGLGIMLFLGAVNDWEGGAWAAGIIPFMIGVGYLLVSQLDNNNRKTSPPPMP